MAVEAQHHHLFSHRSRESLNKLMENDGQMGFADVAGSLAQVYNTAVPRATTNESGSGGIVYNTAVPRATTNESGSGGIVLSKKKRPREITLSSSFLGENVSSQIYSHMLDVDRLVVQHVANARTELLQKRKRFSTQIMAALNELVSKQLKSKDEEIERLRKLNWAMEERMKSLDIESNAWRYLASTNEAAAAALRANLDQVLADQVAAAADDAESCCGDNFCRQEQLMGDWRRMCRSCGSGEPSVLLLPCRHLCLCSACSPAADVCPICRRRKDASVNVNLC